MDLGERLKQAIKVKGYNQTTFGIALGTSHTVVSRVVKGKGYFDFDKMVKAAKLLDVSLDYLVYGDRHTLEAEHSDGYHSLIDMVTYYENILLESDFTTLIYTAKGIIRARLDANDEVALQELEHFDKTIKKA